MPTQLALGLFSSAAQKLRTMLGNSQTWRSLVDEVIHDPDAEFGVYLRNAPDSAQRPFAVLQPALQATWSISRGSGGSQNWLRPAGAVLLYIAIDTPPELQGDDIRAEWHALDVMGGVVQEVVDQSARDDLLAITNVSLDVLAPPDDTDLPSLGAFYYSVWTINWGDSE